MGLIATDLPNSHGISSKLPFNSSHPGTIRDLSEVNPFSQPGYRSRAASVPITISKLLRLGGRGADEI